MSTEPTGQAFPGEARLPAAVAVIGAIARYAALPNQLLIGPRYVVRGLELILFVPLMLANPRRMRSLWSRADLPAKCPGPRPGVHGWDALSGLERRAGWSLADHAGEPGLGGSHGHRGENHQLPDRRFPRLREPRNPPKSLARLAGNQAQLSTSRNLR
jgi:hypothetical protein